MKIIKPEGSAIASIMTIAYTVDVGLGTSTTFIQLHWSGRRW
jgi:hypothetical protein